jgi:hypothetical protein
MKLAKGKAVMFQPQRGFWLRCFLDKDFAGNVRAFARTSSNQESGVLASGGIGCARGAKLNHLSNLYSPKQNGTGNYATQK